MTRYFLLAIALLCGFAWLQTSRLREAKANGVRLAHNQVALMSEMVYYKNKADQEVASVQILRLKCAEFEQLRASDAQCIKDLGLQLRRVEATAQTATQTVVDMRSRLRDTLIYAEHPKGILPDSAQAFEWHDPWVRVSGLIRSDSVVCRIRSIDTLRQVIHRIPRRFWFIRWGTKAVRQEILSANPHTRIVYAEYVRFEK